MDKLVKITLCTQCDRNGQERKGTGPVLGRLFSTHASHYFLIKRRALRTSNPRPPGSKPGTQIRTLVYKNKDKSTTAFLLKSEFR